MTKAAKYLRGQKLSNNQVEMIIACYVHCLTVDEARSGKFTPHFSDASANSIYKIYEMIRRRLFELGYYMTEEHFFKRQIEAQDWGIRFNFQFYKDWMEGMLWDRGSISEDSLRYHISEIIFRRYSLPNMADRDFHLDILEAIRVTGRLNEEAKITQDWYDYRVITYLQRQVAEKRRLPQSERGDLSDLLQEIDERSKRRARRRRNGTLATVPAVKGNYAVTEALLNEIAGERWALCGPWRSKERSRFRIPEFLEIQKEHSRIEIGPDRKIV